MHKSPSSQQVILFLAANPDGLRRVGVELREIKEGLRRSQERDHFTLTPCLDVRPRDIQRALLDDPPQIVHFAGRGVGETGLVFEDETGGAKLVDGAALAGLFTLFADQIRCVVLNGCYSQEQAKAIAQHIDYVIGIRDEISDEAAREFAVSFYDALGAGRSIDFAHKLGCSAIQIQGFAEQLAPVLIQKFQPAEVFSSENIGAQQSRQSWNVPELPPNFLVRWELQSLKAQVLSNVQQSVVLTGTTKRIGVQGMGGIGKSVLVAALARELEVQQAFPDGIFWVTVGFEPLLVVQQTQLAEALGGKTLTFSEVKQGKECLAQLLADKVCLLILDDVWQLDHANAFNVMNSRSQLLVTTRDAELITGLGAINYRLELLSNEQSLSLMALWAGMQVADLPDVAKAVAQECGNLPLALSLCGAMVRDLTPWEYVLDTLRDANLEFLQKHFSHYPYPDVFKTLDISLKVLSKTNPIAAERYRELAVFPTDEAVSEATVLGLWQYTGDLNVQTARQILVTLSSKGMLYLERKSSALWISLHDLQYDYLRSQQIDLSHLHKHLLVAYRKKCPEGWHKGPNDGYFFEHIAHHLIRAGQRAVLQDILFDLRWIQAKLINTDINSLLADYDHLPDNTELQLIRGALQLSAHVLSQDPRQLPSQLHCRLLKQPEPVLHTFRQQIIQFREYPWLRCLTPSLSPAGGSLLRTIIGSASKVVISQDGRFIIASGSGEVKVWEVSTGEEVSTFKSFKAPVEAIAISPDGCFIIESYISQLKVWEVSTGKEIQTLDSHIFIAQRVAVGLDGRFVVLGSWGTVEVWEIPTGKKIQTLEGLPYSIKGLAISPDGSFIISAGQNYKRNDYKLKVWEVSTGQEIHTLGELSIWSFCKELAISPDGSFAISPSGCTIKVWEMSTGQEIRTLEGHTSSINSLAISLDGSFVISGSSDNTVKVWEVSTGQEIRTLEGHISSVEGIAISPDGRFIVSSSRDNTVKIWKTDLSEDYSISSFSSAAHSGSVNDITVSPDGRHVISASSDNTLKIWELSTGRECQTLVGHTSSINGVSVSSDNDLIVSGSNDEKVKIWELASGKEIYTINHRTILVYAQDLTYHLGWILQQSVLDLVKKDSIDVTKNLSQGISVEDVVISPDCRYIITATSYYNSIGIWSTKTGKYIRSLRGHSEDVSGVAISLNGNLIISSSWDKTIKVWELKTGKNILTLRGHSGIVNGVAVSSDNRFVVSASSDKTVKVWELKTGKVLHTLRGHTSTIRGVAISPDDQIIASASSDSTLRLWGLFSGRQVASFTGNGALYCCAFSPDGLNIVTGGLGGQIHFLQLEGQGDRVRR